MRVTGGLFVFASLTIPVMTRASAAIICAITLFYFGAVVVRLLFRHT